MKKIRNLIIVLTICILSFMPNVVNAISIDVGLSTGESITIDAEVADSCENIMQKIEDAEISTAGKILRYKLNSLEFLPGTTLNSDLIGGDIDLYLLDIAIHGNSVLRKSATEASINIISDVAGNIFLQLMKIVRHLLTLVL